MQEKKCRKQAKKLRKLKQETGEHSTQTCTDTNTVHKNSVCF